MLVLMTAYINKIEYTYKKKTIFGKEKEYTKRLDDWYDSYNWRMVIAQKEVDAKTKRIKEYIQTDIKERVVKSTDIDISVDLRVNIKDLHKFTIKDLLELLTPEQCKNEFGFLFNEVRR